MRAQENIMGIVAAGAIHKVSDTEAFAKHIWRAFNAQSHPITHVVTESTSRVHSTTTTQKPKHRHTAVSLFCLGQTAFAFESSVQFVLCCSLFHVPFICELIAWILFFENLSLSFSCFQWKPPPSRIKDNHHQETRDTTTAKVSKGYHYHARAGATTTIQRSTTTTTNRGRQADGKTTVQQNSGR